MKTPDQEEESDLLREVRLARSPTIRPSAMQEKLMACTEVLLPKCHLMTTG
ncbi:hypothetical protein [Streptomyces sp. NPDC058291]|uniref:hypothetical protein n=1 Tax=Streptomyces sp. NPDC058291 TaxID=3346427 RepID=UPI0036ED50B7